eukprot:TRINITY_DN35256_c0_g1_i1.p1 TRINITY_DN35256_c0_g1~~TRINITY_DN35256_c0_g1_i1.p1  ORF type:complete len:3600 (-),score=671.44 TRINITY_DN35256_c0_g1_i1:388-11187(-)
MKPINIVSKNPPPKVKDFIQTITNTPLEDIEAPLSRFTWDFDERVYFQHWTELFVHFNLFFSKYVSSRKDIQLSDDMVDEKNPFPKSAVLEILRVLSIIFENCHNKSSFSGLEHLINLLSSNDPDMLLATLHTLTAFVKISPSKMMHLNAKTPGTAALNRYTLALSQGWGSKEEGLGLYSCATENGCDDLGSHIGSLLHFEFYANQCLKVIHIPDIHLLPRSDISLLKELVVKYNVPNELRFSLWTRIRFARAFSSPATRRQYTCIRLLAFMVLVQSTDNHEELGTFFSNDPEFMNDIIKLLQSESSLPESMRSLGCMNERSKLLPAESYEPESVRSLAMWALGYQFAAVSGSHERSRVSNIPNIASNSANRIFLLSLLQKAVTSFTSMEAYPVSLVEGCLYFFLAYVTSSSTTSNPMRETGLVPALLPLLSDTDPTRTQAVVFAVKILQKYMDYSNPAVALFRDLGGIEAMINRLQYEINTVTELTSDGISSDSVSGKVYFPYVKRRLIRSLLKALASTTYTPPTGRPGSDGTSLPCTLLQIFRYSNKLGGDIFAAGVTLMSELIHKDPTCFPVLHSAGLTTAFLDAISDEMLLPSSKAICCIPGGLDALCLNNIGLEEVTERNALHSLVEIFTSRKFMTPLNACVTPLVVGVEELLRHAPSLKRSGVDVIIKILEIIAAMGGMDSKDKVESPVPMEIDDDEKQSDDDKTEASSDKPSQATFLQTCISRAIFFVHKVMENPETCRMFVEKKGIDALLRFFTLPRIPLSSEYMSIAVHMVAVWKVFTQQHSTALAKAFCTHLRDHVCCTLKNLEPVAASDLLASGKDPDSKVFWCLFVVHFFVFLAGATRENRWMTALITEFGNEYKDVLIDIGKIHRNILWQIALQENTKTRSKKSDSTFVPTTSDLDTRATEIDDHLPMTTSNYMDIILNQHRHSSVWNPESQLFDLIHLFYDIGNRPRFQRRLQVDSSSRSRLGVPAEASPRTQEGSSGNKADSNKEKLLYSFCHEILKSLSFHFSHFFYELGKAMHFPSRRRDDSSFVSPPSKSVAATFASIFNNDLEYDGHTVGLQMDQSVAVKCFYLGKLVDFIQAVILDRQESCNPVLLNSLYTHGVIRLLLTTFEATTQLLWTLLQRPEEMETHSISLDKNDKTWIFGTLTSYATLMGRLCTPSCILGSSSHLLVQPIAKGAVPLPKDPEKFVRMLQSQILKVVLPVWNHPLFPLCNVEFINANCHIMKNICAGVDIKGVKAAGGSTASQTVGPPLDETSIARIVEMGFSRSRAEEALRNVRSNRVEVAMEWLFSHPEEASQEDDELARALALSLGNTDSSVKEEGTANQKDAEQEEELMQAPPIEEILSTCASLLSKDAIAFPVKDLLVTLTLQNEGQERARIVCFLIEQLKRCRTDPGKDNKGLALTSHVIALILNDDGATCEIASESGLVTILLDILSMLSLHQSEKGNTVDDKALTPMILALDSMLQLKQSKKDVSNGQHSDRVTEISEVNQQNRLESILKMPEPYMTPDEQKRTMDIVANFVQMHLPSTTMQGLLQLCAKLTRVHAIALSFLEKGGLAALLNLPSDSLFPGFDTVASTIIRHILEDPHTLQVAMEFEIRHSFMTVMNRSISGRVSPRNFLSNLAPVISRDPIVFLRAAEAVCQIEMIGERPYVILSKDREKEKGKEKERSSEKERSGLGDRSPIGNSVTSSVKISDASGKSKGHKRTPQSFAVVIEQLLDSITQFSPPIKSDLGKKSEIPGSVMDMEVDEVAVEEKGKSIIGKGSQELKDKDSVSLALSTFILKVLTEIILMYPSAVNVVIRWDTERANVRGSSAIHHLGPLCHVLHTLLPYSGVHSKEKHADDEWKKRLSSKASQFLLSICVRSGEGRKRIFMEIVHLLNVSSSSSTSSPRPPDNQMSACIDLINDVLAARSPSGSNILAEVSKTLVDVGIVQALCCTLQNLDLDNPDSVKIVNGIIKALELLTMEQVQNSEDSQQNENNVPTTGSNPQESLNETENPVASPGNAEGQRNHTGTESFQMESPHDTQVAVQSAANLLGSEDDFTNEGVEEDVGMDTGFSMEHGGHDSLADDDEDMSGDGGDEDAEDDEEEEEDELDEDDVHDMSHANADHDDHDDHELGEEEEEEYDEVDFLEDGEDDDDDDENNLILRLEDGINIFDHIEVLDRAEADFPSDPFHVMPIEEVFGTNRRHGRTTSIYNLLGRTDERGTAFQHPLLVAPVASSAINRRGISFTGNDRAGSENTLESSSTVSDLDSIFRSVRSRRPGSRLSSWADDSQQLRGVTSNSVALAMEQQFVSQLQRAHPQDETSPEQAQSVKSNEKTETSTAHQTDSNTGMVNALQTQATNEGAGGQSEQHQTGENNADSRNVVSTEAGTQTASMENRIQGAAANHDTEMTDERNERVMRDMEAVSQDSGGSGATLGESLRSLEVEIGSADGHDEGAERPTLMDSHATRVQPIERIISGSGDVGQTAPPGNSGAVPEGSTTADASSSDIVMSNSQTLPVQVPSEQQQSTAAGAPASNSIDPTFLEALPEEIRSEVLASQHNQAVQSTSNPSPTPEEIDPEFLAALPPDIRAEVLAQQHAQRLLQSHQIDGQHVDIDSVSILATFPPELREEVLSTSSDAVLANLPETLVSEARRLRERFGFHLNGDRFSSFHRGRRNGLGGGRNISLGRDRPSSHRTGSDKLTEADGKPLLDIAAIKALLRVLCIVQPIYKGSLQRLLLNVCSYSVSRVSLVQLLLNLLMIDAGFSVGSPYADAADLPHRLYGCLGHVVYSRPQFTEGVPPLVSRRALETLAYLAQNHPVVAGLLLHLETPSSKTSVMDPVRGKAVQNERNYIVEDPYKFPVVLLLKLLKEPLYSRSTAHLEQLTCLIRVILNNIQSNKASSSQPTLADSEMNAVAGEHPSDAQPDSSNVNNNSPPSTSTEKMDPVTVLSKIPETELRILSALLGFEGLSEVAYSYVSDILMKLVKLVPSHRCLLITELASATERLTVDAISELRCFGEGETMPLSTPVSGLAILRVLQTLSPLSPPMEKEKDDEILPETDTDESALIVQNLNVSLEPLWLELSICIAKIENRTSSTTSSGLNGALPPLPPGTQQILPYIEAFFVACEKLQPTQAAAVQLEYSSATASEVKEAASLSDSTSTKAPSMQQRKAEEKGVTLIKFAEKHRRLLNAFVRQNPGLLEKSFSLLLKVPRLIEFDNKRAYFRSKIRQHQDHQNYGSLRISVRRAYLLEDSYNQLRLRSARDLKGRLNVHFQGEEGIDAGGLTREWYQLLSRVIFDKGALLFTTVGNEMTFQPNPNSVYQTEHLSYFKFVGRVVAKALYDGQLLDVHFTRSFYKHILGSKVTYHDIEAIDPDYYKNLKWMLENDIRDMPDLTFSMDADEEKHILYERDEVTDHELIPNGRNIRVTEENKHEYVDLVAEHRLTTTIRPQINAFLEGFNELIPKNLISIFNDRELELLISGLPEIDLDDLRANTEYSGYSPASSVIQWFWEIVYSFSKEDKARLLQFVTGTSKVPLEGFKALQGISGLQKFQIHKAYGSPDRLPSAHTCFNQLDLPEYTSKEQLEERLLLAIHEGSEGFGFG